jgi:chromate transporter
MLYFSIFIEFFKTGLFAVGGGLATLPFLYAMSAATGWFTQTDIANMLAIAQSTPGAIGLNIATYAGYYIAGVPGCIISSLSLVLPSIIVITLVARFISKFQESRLVVSVFYGLRPASTGLVAASGLGVLTSSLLRIEIFSATHNLLALFQWKSLFLAAVLFFLIRKTKWHPASYIALSAAAGILLSLGQ